MCGIAGLVEWHAVPGGDRVADVRRICQEIGHRGPDGTGVVEAGRSVLGHCRLAVIDLSPAGAQPMSNEDGSVWVVFNGEIYNHRELRTALSTDHAFRSRSDTEVLLHGYEAWGMTGLLSRLRGMFAFALWDSAADALWLVRDRLGVKPLFYASSGDRVTFSSEPGPLYRHVNPGPEAVDPVALDFYLTFGHMPPDRALVRGVSKVAPATAVEFRAGVVRESRYWAVPDPESAVVSDDEFVHALSAAVGDRLESDVPLGFFLSGGIDSGLVLALAATSGVRAPLALTVGFRGEGDIDESGLAATVAARYGATHERIDGGVEREGTLERLTAFAGEPLADPSLLPTTLVCESARRHVTVALTGDGGDELFGGYLRVVATRLGEDARRLVGGGGLKALRRLTTGVGFGRRVSTICEYGLTDVADLYLETGAVFPEAQRARLYREAPSAGVPSLARAYLADSLAGMHHLPKADAYARLDIRYRLPGRYLTKVDTASNAVALECRSPFLDHRVAELALSVGTRGMTPFGQQKGRLRRIARRYLPDAVVRAPKRGFSTGAAALLTADRLDQLRQSAIGAEGGPLRQDVVDTYIARHRTGDTRDAERLWALVCLDTWWRTFISARAEPVPMAAVAG